MHYLKSLIILLKILGAFVPMLERSRPNCVLSFPRHSSDSVAGISPLVRHQGLKQAA
jgi:hypothetical protein